MQNYNSAFIQTRPLDSHFKLHALGAVHFIVTICGHIGTSAYLAAMGQARDAGVRSLAFSLLSGGYFRGSQPLSKVLEIGVEAIAHGACKHDTFERAQALTFPR